MAPAQLGDDRLPLAIALLLSRTQRCAVTFASRSPAFAWLAPVTAARHRGGGCAYQKRRTRCID